MNLEINKREHELLLALVDSRVSELHPEIRRCMDHAYKESLKSDLQHMQSLLERLRSLDDSGD